jgi:hypothetical protein
MRGASNEGRGPWRCQVHERIRGGGAPGGGIMEVVAWQPNLLGRASKSAQEGDKPSVCRVRRGVPSDTVIWDAKNQSAASRCILPNPLKLTLYGLQRKLRLGRYWYIPSFTSKASSHASNRLNAEEGCHRYRHPLVPSEHV